MFRIFVWNKRKNLKKKTDIDIPKEADDDNK